MQRGREIRKRQQGKGIEAGTEKSVGARDPLQGDRRRKSGNGDQEHQDRHGAGRKDKSCSDDEADIFLRKSIDAGFGQSCCGMEERKLRGESI